MGGGGGPAIVAAAVASTAAFAAAATGRLPLARALLGVAAALAGAAVVLLGVAFWRVDTSLVEVATTTSRSTGAPLRVAGLWGGPAGSLLFFATLTAIGAATAARRLPAAGVIALAVAVSALLAVSAIAQPFREADLAPLDGAGLVPVLRRTSMLVHPPVLYAGMVLVLVAAAYGVADLAGQADDPSRSRARRVALVAWSLLAAGMVLGSRWAHREVGWGGVWAWDPVEDAALLPWLVLTGGLHQRSARGWWAGAGLVAWAGIWATRSGRLDSVHAFSGQGAVGAGLGMALVALAAGVAFIVISRRGRDVYQPAWCRSPAALLAGAAAWIGVGTGWAALGGGDRSVAAGFYVSVVGPLAVVALAVLARGAPRAQLVAALLVGSVGSAALLIAGWRSNGILAIALVGPAAVTGVLARSGGRWVTVAHLGFVLVVAGGIATTAGEAGTIRLAVGEERRVAGVSVRLLGFEEVAAPDHKGVATRLDVGGRAMEPALVEVEQRGPRADVATASNLLRELQVALVSTDGQGTAVISVSTTPGAAWVWGGGLLLALGGVGETAARRGRRPGSPRGVHEPAPEPVAA